MAKKYTGQNTLKALWGLGIPKNLRVLYLVTPTIGITYETWTNIEKPWTESGITIAAAGYRWVTKWETGKHYIITKIFDEQEELVGIYCDISTPITKTKKGFEFYDWYLDVWQEIGKEPIILDEDELEEALKEKYISTNNAKIAKQTARYLTNILLTRGEELNF